MVALQHLLCLLHIPLHLGRITDCHSAWGHAEWRWKLFQSASPSGRLCSCLLLAFFLTKACCCLAQPAVSTETPFLLGLPPKQWVPSLNGYVGAHVCFSLSYAHRCLWSHPVFSFLSQLLCTDQSSGDGTVFKSFTLFVLFVISREDWMFNHASFLLFPGAVYGQQTSPGTLSWALNNI